MPTPWQRDLERDRTRIERWLADRLPEARGLAVRDLRAPESSGFSNDTLLFELETEGPRGPKREPLVLRIAPTGFQVFPEYDLALQYRAMSLLAKTDVPVPRVRWLEADDRGLLGAPFYLMDRVEGRVPTDRPPYHTGGWMTEITPSERAAIWWGGIDCMARVHRLDPEAVGFGFLARPELGPTPFRQQLAYYERYLEWAARGLPQPTIEAALAWLRASEPDDPRTVLLWGDARIGNIIFEGTRPAAVLDWEMVTLGSPEEDLAWAIFLDRHHSEGLGVPRLEGFPSFEETVERYQALTGFEVRHLHFWQVFAGFRFAVIMARIAQQMVHYQVMTPEQGRAFELDNTVTQLLAKLLELPPPGEARA
ncbi:MAG TPA: phosphotransferase family protein [Myxococcota bacterium]|nr:phosphotransferase family protein [Myxococcota bacterium]